MQRLEEDYIKFGMKMIENKKVHVDGWQINYCGKIFQKQPIKLQNTNNNQPR